MLPLQANIAVLQAQCSGILWFYGLSARPGSCRSECPVRLGDMRPLAGQKRDGMMPEGSYIRAMGPTERGV